MEAPPSPPESSPALRRTKIVLAIAVIVGAIVAQQVGVFRDLSDPSRAARALVDLGPWGYVAFVLAYAALQPFGVPGTVFVFAAPLIWPWPIAFALSMVGTMAASAIGFAFSRFVARDWVRAHIPARFQKYDDALERRAFATVFFMRFVFWMPPPLHAFFGVSKVPFWTHFWGSFFGYLLPLFLVSFFGQQMFDALKNVPPQAWVAAGVATIMIAAIVWLRRRHTQAA